MWAGLLISIIILAIPVGMMIMWNKEEPK